MDAPASFGLLFRFDKNIQNQPSLGAFILSDATRNSLVSGQL